MALQHFSYRKLGLGYLVWCICWVVLQTIALQQSFNMAWQVAFTDGLITNVLIAASGYVMISIMNFYQPNQTTRLAMSLTMTALCLFAMWHLSPILIKGPEYRDFLERSLFIRGLYTWLMIALITAITWLWSSVREQQEIESRKSATEKLAREAELSRLRLQLQPHFLFNSLNSISALAGSKPEEARKMIQQLSDFLRGTLKKDDQQMVLLSEELQHLQLYLDIEKVRFGHRLKTHIVNDERALKMKLPPLLLQPVVENAIKFGLYDTTGEIIVRVDARADNNNDLEVTVENPFDPSTSQPKQGTGFGLTSVQRRLYLLYARQDLLTTSQHENLFTTQIKIPQHS